MLALLAVLIIPAAVLGGCPAGYTKYGNSADCYKTFIDQWVTFDMANDACAKEGGYLTPVKGEDQITFLSSIAKYTDNKAHGWQEQPLVGITKESEKWGFNIGREGVYRKFCTDFSPNPIGRECAILVVSDIKSNVDKMYDRKKTEPCLVPVHCDNKYTRFVCKWPAKC